MSQPTTPDAWTAIRPTTQMVADLVRTRLVHEGGDMGDSLEPDRVDDFDDRTYPSATQVERLIDQATNFLFIQLPGSVSEPWAPAGKHLATLYAAILVEASYFREQLTDDQVALYRNLLDAGIKGLGAQIASRGGHVASRQVDATVMRSVMTAPPGYLHYLDMQDVGAWPDDVAVGDGMDPIEPPPEAP